MVDTYEDEIEVDNMKNYVSKQLHRNCYPNNDDANIDVVKGVGDNCSQRKPCHLSPLRTQTGCCKRFSKKTECDDDNDDDWCDYSSGDVPVS